MEGAWIEDDGVVRYVDRVDQVTSAMWPSAAALARHYWHWSRLSDREKDDDDQPMTAWQAVDALLGFVQEPSDHALDVIDALLDAAESADELVLVGAGPLESLLRHRGHGLRFAAEVEERARRSSRWREAVLAAWFAEDVPAQVQQRLGPQRWTS